MSSESREPILPPSDPTTPEVAPGDEAPPGTPGTGENLCPECSGKGTLNGGEQCPSCEGTGTTVQGVGGG